MNQSKRLTNSWVHQSKELWVTTYSESKLTNSLCHSIIKGDQFSDLSSDFVLFNIRMMLVSFLCSPALQRKGSWPLNSLGSFAGCGRMKECRRVSSDHESISSMIQQPSKCTFFRWTKVSVGPSRVTIGVVHHNNMFDIQKVSKYINKHIFVCAIFLLNKCCWFDVLFYSVQILFWGIVYRNWLKLYNYLNGIYFR